MLRDVVDFDFFRRGHKVHTILEEKKEIIVYVLYILALIFFNKMESNMGMCNLHIRHLFELEKIEFCHL